MARDPWVEPPGYTPPRDARELLARYQQGERFFEGAWLDWADLHEVELRDANLARSSLCATKLEWASLQNVSFQEANMAGASLYASDLTLSNLTLAKLEGVNMSMANLHGADLSMATLEEINLHGSCLKGANLSLATLRRANLQDADLSLANLMETDFENATLTGVNLSEALGTPQDRNGCTIDYKTYALSGWAPDTLGDWQQAGATIHDMDAFPGEIRDALLHIRKGLTLHLQLIPERLHRFLLEGLLLGLSRRREHNATLAELDRRSDGKTVARISSDDVEELEWIANLIHRRFWEQPPQARSRSEDEALEHLHGVFNAGMLGDLSNFTNHIKEMELYMPFEGHTLHLIHNWDSPPSIQPTASDEDAEKTGVRHRSAFAAPKRHGDVAQLPGMSTQVIQQPIDPNGVVGSEQFQSLVQTVLKALVEFRSDLDGRLQRFERFRVQGAFEEIYKLPTAGRTVIEVHAMIEEIWLLEVGEHFTAGLRRLEGTRILEAFSADPLGSVVVALALGNVP